MNKIVDMPRGAMRDEGRDTQDHSATMIERIGTAATAPTTVAGAVLGAAALGFLAARRKLRPALRRGPAAKAAAHALATKPLPAQRLHAQGLQAVQPAQSARPIQPIQYVPSVEPPPKRRLFGLTLPIGKSTPGSRRARAAEKAAAKGKGRAKGTTRQLMDLGKSLVALGNAYAAFKAGQAHVDPVPAPEDTDPVTGPTGVALAKAQTANPPAAFTTAVAAPQPQLAFAPMPAGSLMKRAWYLIKTTISAWSDDYAPSMGAALSYYTLFSLAPMLVIVIAVAGLIFGADAARGEIVTQLGGLMGKEGATAVEGLLKSANHTGEGIIATVIGVITLLIGSTAVFAELQSSLDRIWRTPAPANESGIWGLIRTRILSFGLILGLGFLSMVSLVVSAAVAALGRWWGSLLGDWEIVLQILNFFVSFGVVTAMFAMIYKFMPRAKMSWHDVWLGALSTALLFSIGKFLIGLYIGKSGVASGFGAAGSLVVLLVWVYYSAQIFLLGAEFTWVYTHRHAPPPIRPDAAIPSRTDAAPAATAA
jgi:membrane protein